MAKPIVAAAVAGQGQQQQTRYTATTGEITTSKIVHGNALRK